ncbi:hypothetical protein CPB84DRAFT_1849207 [Gymnopilus junonius]|uniref:Uncharacterized protein n=1 Tax=Gymnopilus junonius TaxID=109634 RepID=A0A9P5NI85_GYMJU|nr:hypothetical protein CPB84DRAFT_1849207 [Gymnopilus junonius]
MGSDTASASASEAALSSLTSTPDPDAALDLDMDRELDALELDEGCRILTISASVDAAKEFVGLLKARSTPFRQAPPPPAPSSTSSTTSIPHIIPYTLANRYYTADLHFALWPLDGAAGAGGVLRGGVFKQFGVIGYHQPQGEEGGEPYAKHVEQLSQMMQVGGYEPEVCLAVRIPKRAAAAAAADVSLSAPQAVSEPADADKSEDGEEEEDNADIDSTLMSFGFEYVDATQETTRTSMREADDIDIPGLPRVFDALSTIMWPSMRTPAEKVKGKAKTTTGGSSSTTKIAHHEERILIMEELLSVSEISGLGGWTGSVLIGQEEEEVEVVEGGGEGDEELGTPVEFNYGFERRGDAPWLTGSGSGSGMSRRQMPGQGNLSLASTGGEGRGELTASPTDMNSLSPFGFGEMAENGQQKTSISMGFEDDFTVFVSAPPLGAASNTSVAEGEEEGDHAFKGGLGHDLHLHAGLNPYRSLGSVSDFGGSDFGDEHGHAHVYETLEDADGEGWEDRDEKEWEEEGLEEEEEEEGLPSKDEIRQTAARIFGGVSVGKGKEREVKGMFGKASDVLKAQQQEHPSAAMRERMMRLGGMAAALEEEAEFDLERVLHSLQAMRSEIGDIEDEDEKRRMAARVALGLVYGLEH